MKALTVIMPWPWLILKYGKDVENRTWRTGFRGQILIHVSGKLVRDQIPMLIECGARPTKSEIQELLHWPGRIVGTVELVDCVRGYDSLWAQKDMWHWVLKNPRLLKTLIPAKGSLGLWEYSGNIGVEI
jgi:hypothetical protein